MVRVKGSMLVLLVKAIRADRSGRLLAAVPAEHREAVGGMILPIRWYPFELYQALQDTLVRVLAAGDMEIVRQWGRVTAEDAMTTTYSAVLRQGDPIGTLANYESFFRRFFEGTEFVVQPLGGDRALVRVAGFPPDWQPIYHVIRGWLEKTLELVGARGPQVDFRARSWEGHAPTEYLVAAGGAR